MLRFYADALQASNRFFMLQLCCKIPPCRRIKVIAPNTCVAFIFLSHRHAISVERVFVQKYNEKMSLIDYDMHC
jgi:hypothetical protein